MKVDGINLDHLSGWGQARPSATMRNGLFIFPIWHTTAVPSTTVCMYIDGDASWYGQARM